MLKRFISLIIVASVFITQISAVKAAEPNFTHTQTSIPVVSGNGIFIEAEDCSYTAWYSVETNSSASGNKALIAKQAQKDAESSSKRGEFEVSFTAQKAGTHIIWLRAYATSGSQDSYYASFSGQGYESVSITPYSEFTWIKSGNIYLQAGQKTTFRAFPREKSHLVDAVIITPTNFVPSGKTGDIPEGEYGDYIVSKYAPTPYQPPAEHPRVLFTASDIPRIKANMEAPQNAELVKKFNELSRTYVVGNAAGRYNENMLREIEARAFDYAINGNEASGKRAVASIMSYFVTSNPAANGGNETRNGGMIMFTASEVYDWCYDLMTDEQRNTVISVCEGYAHNMEIKWPPDGQGCIVGHASEAQLLRDMLAFAIATYDERPDIWESVGGRFYEEYTEARDFYNKGHFALQGDSYGLYRHNWDTYSYLLITGMGLPSPYNAEDLAQVAYGHLYMRRPDGQFLRDGDTSEDTNYGMWKYWSRYGQPFLVDATILNDPYLKDEAFAMSYSGQVCYSSSPIVSLIINNPDLQQAAISNLPKSRFFGDPAGMMIARTGWDRGVDTNDVIAEMKIGGVRQNNHQHYDAGHFQIYYKGILASDSGVYQGLQQDDEYCGTSYNSAHRKQYMIKTIAHNSMLVYDPTDEVDGGQRLAANGSEPARLSVVLDNMEEYRVATVLAQEIDPKHPIDPEYTYIKGDLTKAYSGKVSDFKRSFMFLNLFEDEVPAALIVFDRVKAASKTFKKTWLLHGVEKPTVNGTQTVFRRTYKSTTSPSGYNGKMTVDTLLPKASNADITIVGGEEEGFSIVNGVDITGYPSATKVDEGNTYRMELSPKTQGVTDYFLNVIQVSDNDKDYYADVKMVENSLFYGVRIRDRLVLFAKNGSIVGTNFSITVPDKYKFTVCDMKAGTWQISSNEGTEQIVTDNKSGVLAFEASGTVQVSYVSESGTPVKPSFTLGTAKECRLKIDGQFVNGKEKPELKDGNFMMSLSTFAEWFDIRTYSQNGVITLTKGNDTAKISKGSNTLNLNGNNVSMKSAPYEKNGEIMVSASDMAEVFGGDMDWYPITLTAEIFRPEEEYSLPKGYAAMVNVTNDGGAVDGENYPTNVIDEDPDTIWAANGVGRYIDIELDREYMIDRVEIVFNPNGSRTAKFDIFVSDDGKSYTKVLSSVSDGGIERVSWELYPLSEPVSAKYVRYVGNGSNISNWNGVKEIRFRLYEAHTVLAGDVNKDGEVNAKDNAFLGRYLARWIGYDETNIDKEAADVTADGEVNAKDNAFLARHLARWIGYEVLQVSTK